MAEDITLNLTQEQASALYRLIYDHGHWESSLFFPIENALIEALEIDEQALEENREDKDKGVGKLFTLFREGGPQALAEALELGTPEAINMEASAWQDLEVIWYQVSVSRSHSDFNESNQAKLQEPFQIECMWASETKGELGE